MHQDATKRHYLKEQSSEIEVPIFTDTVGNKYFVPGIDQKTFNDFVTFNEYDSFPSKLNMLSSLGVKAGLQNNPLSVPKETVEKEIQQFTKKLKETNDMETAMKGLNFLPAIGTLENSLSTAVQTYLKMWRPNMKGVNLINNVAFQNNPKIQQAKRLITNLDEVLPKVLEMKSKKFGINVV